MIKEYTYFCKGTCSRQINYKIDTETNKLVDIEIIGGCNGKRCAYKIEELLKEYYSQFEE